MRDRRLQREDQQLCGGESPAFFSGPAQLLVLLKGQGLGMPLARFATTIRLAEWVAMFRQESLSLSRACQHKW